jgi:hypothetical protein
MRRAGARSAPFIALVGLVALVAGGCQYLLGYPTGPDVALPSPSAAYREGHATISVGTDPVITLGALSQPGTFDTMLGSEATFRGDDGWYLRVIGATSGSGFMQTAFVQLDRIAGGEHWTTADPSRCVVTIATADKDALRGSASCKGLRWSDAIAGGMYGGLAPSYIVGQPAFDAEITFEATPRTPQA